MDQSCAESDISLSPSHILDRLQVLRQLQLLQRGKLQKQRLQYQETTENSSSLTEIVSQFSNSTSYNTFRSLLQSSCETSNDATPRPNTSKTSPRVQDHELIDGVAVLNLSQESEFILNSPLSSRVSAPCRNENTSPFHNTSMDLQHKKHIALDEMPILSSKQNFESLLLQKLKEEKAPKAKSPKENHEVATQAKKPFLKRGEGMARFGVKKSDLIIQNTKTLPWRKQSLETRVSHTPKKVKNTDKVHVQIVASEPSLNNKEQSLNKDTASSMNNVPRNNEKSKPTEQVKCNIDTSVSSNSREMYNNKSIPKIQLPKEQHPLKKINRGSTWAAVLTKEQDDFLRQLKQSDYYKNFTSPAKSIVSDMSCDDHLYNVRQEKETAEQHMFELLENKVTNHSFSLENSFFNKFLKKSMECSGESTPMIMKQCLANNPELFHIFPDVRKKRPETHSECSCEYTECSDADSMSTCSTCKTVEEPNNTLSEERSSKESKKTVTQKNVSGNKPKKREEDQSVEKCKESKKKKIDSDTVTEADVMKANMTEMNAKLIATSELLKERLKELEDEIETFRKENSNLTKMREEIDLERQKFYEEKHSFEQKFNEEKILSEYYLAEEKEKLAKQKQTYERYVREMRGRLNKKEKDDVINLRKEISDLKEEIRQKDAKSTSTIARLRNQLKLMEKEKGNLHDEVEKLKKENRRIQHSNEITRRLTNVKYLEEINKKLTNMSKTTHSDVQLDKDVKYKAFEIERQSRSRRVQLVSKGTSRPRAKSVPNLKVTSRYAKYFSQKDSYSEREGNESLNVVSNNYCPSDDEIADNNKLELDDAIDDDDSIDDNVQPQNEDDNYLEKIYMERFQNASPVSNRSSLTNENYTFKKNPDPFFIRNPNSQNVRQSKSPVENLTYPTNGINDRSKSPVSILSNRSSGRKSPAIDTYAKDHSSNSNSYSRSKSPISILSNRSSGSQRLATVVNQEQYRDKLLTVSPEPSTSKTSLTKTNLNPTEIKKPDGSRELRFPNGNVKYLSADEKYTKFLYYNGDVKENFYSEGRIKYFYAEAKTFHTTHADGLEVLEFPDGQVEKRYKDGSSEIRLPNGSIRYHDPKNEHVREEWRFPDGTALTVSAAGEQRIVFSNGQIEVHSTDHKRREFPDGTVKLVYNDGTSETRYASGRVRIKDKHGNLIMDSAPGGLS